jgi:nitrate/nitrite-specific signal transduction histidine kinase
MMSGIVLLALLSMISSVLIAESSKGDAAAINLAGSLRMQSYRIATVCNSQTVLILATRKWWSRKLTNSSAD